MFIKFKKQYPSSNYDVNDFDDYNNYFDKKIHLLVLFTFIFLLFFNLTNVFIGGSVVVSGNSMYPTLKDRESIFLNKVIYYFDDIDYNDVIVFESHNSENDSFVKRVIGKPGDTIEIIDSVLYRNGKKVHEIYLDSQYKSKYESITGFDFTNNFSLTAHAYDDSMLYLSDLNMGKFKKSNLYLITIPNDYYFVMGDNRPVSMDSREIGLIPRKYISGKVYNYFDF